jgi:hypothetical protein
MSASAFAFAVVLIACGGGGAPNSEPEPSVAGPEAAHEPPTGMAAEPILYSDSRFAYPGFQRAGLDQVHAALTELVGDRVQLRVIPYTGTDPDSGETVLKGETLEIYYLTSAADLSALRPQADQTATVVREAFPGLQGDYKVALHARLPDGRTVADLNPELSEACGENNMVRTGIALSEYEPGHPESLFEFLCDGAQVVDPYFIEKGWDHLPGAWRTSDTPS